MRVVLIVLLSAAAFGAELTGRIEQTGGIAMRIRDRGQLVTIYVNKDSRVIGGPLSAGDEIRVDFHQDGKRMIADRIYASITVSGTVTEMRDDEFWIETSRPRRETRLIRIRRDTVFGSSRKDLAVDAEVLVVGWDMGDGSIDAARVAIYGTDTPVQPTGRSRLR